MKPDEVVAALQLSPGQVVADIGSGPGYFALRFARAVGPMGRVYGVDIEPQFLAELRRLAQAFGLSNVVPVLTTPDESGLLPASCDFVSFCSSYLDEPGLPSAACDVIFFCSSYRYVKDRVVYLRRLQSRLKPGGRIAIIEWKKIATLKGEKRNAARVGPLETDKIDPEDVVLELQEAGLTLLERQNFLEYHYFLIAGVQN